MGARNPLREALQAGRFCYVVELVASRISREAQLLEIATQLGQIPGVVAGTIRFAWVWLRAHAVSFQTST